jgi:DNA-binding transcriptional ArsR family regulator
LKPDRDITDPQIAKALAHPLRVRILGILDVRVACPSELADELGADLGVVSYHVRTLARAGLLKLVRKKQRRGAVEHFYKAADRPVVTSEAWSRMPTIVKQAMIGATLGQVAEHVQQAAAGGGFEPDDAHLTRTPMTLDAQGWKEVAARLEKLLADVKQIAKKSGDRLAKNDHEGAIDSSVVLMLFQAMAVPEEKPKARSSSVRNDGSRGRVASRRGSR